MNSKTLELLNKTIEVATNQELRYILGLCADEILKREPVLMTTTCIGPDADFMAFICRKPFAEVFIHMTNAMTCVANICRDLQEGEG